ncbi:acyl-CoA thioesterase [Fimbriimonas ginsengisoli]|nr:acyl-CoA thioesterase [Fimbriimonas ginsengisoli]
MSELTAKRVSETRVEMALVMEPNDANFLGKVFGGTILSKIDLCGYATASRFAGTICVTASFDRVDFLEPIEVGELVTFVGHVSYAGRTSVEVTIEVYAENILQNIRRHTNTARVTMVAIRDNKPTPVPKLIFETREDKIRFLEGKLRRELRFKQREERQRIFDDYAQASDEELDRLLDRSSGA